MSYLVVRQVFGMAQDSTRRRLTAFCFAVGAASVPLQGAGMPGPDCLIEPQTVVNVGSAVAGIVESMEVDKNDWVEQGQVLARFESVLEQAVLTEARARAEMVGEVGAKQARLDLAMWRQKRTAESVGGTPVSSGERDEAAIAVVLAKMELRQAREKKRLARLELQRMVEALNRRLVRSPISGLVVERFASPGEFVKEAPLLKLALMDPLRVEARAPASMFGSIEPGMVAEIVPNVPRNARYVARVSGVDSIIDADSHAFGVRLELPNPDHRIPAGTGCRVRFVSPPGPGGPEEGSGTAGPDPDGTRPLSRPAATGKPTFSAAGSGTLEPTPSRAKPAGENRVSGRAGSLQADSQAPPPGTAPVARGSAEKTGGLPAGAGYLVLAPPQKTSSQRRRLFEQMKQAGVTDFAIIRRGRFKGRISLGVYLGRRWADRRRAELGALGFEVEVVARRGQTAAAPADVQREAEDRTKNDRGQHPARLQKAGSAQTPENVPAASTRNSASLVCRSIGPLENTSQVRTLETALIAQNLSQKINRRRVADAVIDDYLVLAPAQQTARQTRRLLEQMKKSGVSDLALIRRGQFRGRISLGIYSRKRWAEERRNQLASRGFDTAVVWRIKKRPGLWLDVEIPAGTANDKAIAQLIGDALSGASPRILDCAAIAGK